MKSRNIQRVLAFAFVLCMLVTTGLCEAKESGTANCKKLNEIELSAQGWYGLKETRALLVLGMVADCSETLPDSAASVMFEALAADALYVANAAENEVDVFCFGKDARFVFRYVPKWGLATYEVVKQKDAYLNSQEFMEQLLDNKKCTSYDRITMEEMQKFVEN